MAVPNNNGRPEHCGEARGAEGHPKDLQKPPERWHQTKHKLLTPAFAKWCLSAKLTKESTLLNKTTVADGHALVYSTPQMTHLGALSTGTTW